MPDFDVIVVGGGPSGSTAALQAAKAGLKTIILEKDRDIGYPVRCGEAVGDEGLRYFIPEPDPRWIAATIERVRMRSPDNTALTFDSPGKGYILHRRMFDFHLASLAAAAGSDIQTKAYVDGLLFEDGKVSGVEYQHFGERKRLTARVVIGADGVESRVGRMAGLRTALKLADTESGYQVSVGNVDVDQDVIDFFVGSNWAPGGYLWIFPKGEGMANIGLGVEGRFTRDHISKELVHNFLKEHFPKAAVMTAVAGGIPVSTALKKMYTDGLLLVGDAARMVNPLSGGGIISGMRGGEIAGQLAVDAIQKGDTSAAAFKTYPARWRKVAGKQYERFYRIAQYVRELDDAYLDKIAHELVDVPAEKLSILKVFTTVARHKPAILLEITRAYANLL